MKYNPTNPFERKQAEIYFTKLLSGQDTFELTRCGKSRTNDQNRLFHLWVSVFADSAGYISTEDCKRDIIKHLIGQREYRNPLTGKTEMVDYHTHLMDTKELADLMDRFKIWAQTDWDCYLPYWQDAGYNEMCNSYKNK